MRTRELTPFRRRHDRAAKPQVTIGLDICRSALSSLSDELVESAVSIVTASMRQRGLRGDIGEYEALRQALRNIVTNNLHDMLAERIDEIDKEADPCVRADLRTHRQTLNELLLECRR